jgi:hypothetical protein
VLVELGNVNVIDVIVLSIQQLQMEEKYKAKKEAYAMDKLQ